MVKNVTGNFDWLNLVAQSLAADALTVVGPKERGRLSERGFK
jgi:hypothetical protein